MYTKKENRKISIVKIMLNKNVNIYELMLYKCNNKSWYKLYIKK